MLSDGDSIKENTNVVVVADDRSIPLRSGQAETVGELDRRRSFETSPNSRQSRRTAMTSRSYLQGRGTSQIELASVIGIDVSKSKLDVADCPKSFVDCFDNNTSDHQELLKKLPEAESCLVVLDAIGGYEKHVVLKLVNAGYLVSVVNPRQVRNFTKALGILVKTDRIDARLIVRFGQQIRPRAIAQFHENRMNSTSWSLGDVN